MKCPNRTKFIVGGRTSYCGWQVSAWFEEYCDGAPVAFTGEDGWSVPLPAAIGEALRRTLAEYAPAPSVLEGQAANICAAAMEGEIDERARLTVAQIAKAKAQIEALQVLIRDLAQGIERLDRWTLEAVEDRGYEVNRLQDELIEAREGLWRAVAGLRAQPSGRPRLGMAPKVTFATATAFQLITGKRPTFTTSTDGGAITGVWPDTLRAVFTAAGIEASVEAQARALQRGIRKGDWAQSEKTPPWET